MNEEKYNLQNPHPVETRKYSYRDMMECWVAERENLVRWGVGDGDKPDFSSWIKENFDSRRDVAMESLPRVIMRISDGELFVLNKNNKYELEKMQSFKECGHKINEYSYTDLMISNKGYFRVVR